MQAHFLEYERQTGARLAQSGRLLFYRMFCPPIDGQLRLPASE